MCGGLLLTPPGPPAKDPGTADRRGGLPQLGLVFLSSRLFCSFSALPAPACRTQVGRSLGPSGFFPVTSPSPSPGHKSWGVCPKAGPGPARATLMPQPQAAEDTLGFLHQGLRHAPKAWSCHRPSRRGYGGGPNHTKPPPRAHAQGLGSEEKSTVQLGQRHAGRARAAPKGHRPRGRRPWGLRPWFHCWSHGQGLAPVMPSSPDLCPAVQ